MNSPNVPECLANLSPCTRVFESDGENIAAYSGHYGIRLRRAHEAGSWRRSLEELPWESPGPVCTHLWPDMTGPANGEIKGSLYRELVYAVGAAEGMSRVVKRYTPTNKRDWCVDGIASLVLGTNTRIVVSSGKEFDPRDRLGKKPDRLLFSKAVDGATSGAEDVEVNAQYLIEIMDVIGRALEIWVRGPMDPIGLRGLYGDAVLMPMRL